MSWPFQPLLPGAGQLLAGGAGTDALSANSTASGAPFVGSPAITQVHALAADGIASASPFVGTPALAQVHALSAANVSAAVPFVGSSSLGQVHALNADGVASGSPFVGSPVLAEGDTVDDLAANDVFAGAPILETPTLGIVGQQPVQPQATGGWEWLNTLNPPRRREPDPEPVSQKPKRRVVRDRTVELLPDPVIERGIVKTVPAWDAMIRLQQMQQEAEIARLERLRAIALADDDWLMMA